MGNFVGRSSVFAEQSKSGAYYPVRRSITDDDIQEHLAGLWSIGTYTITPAKNGKFYVNYVVFDLDTGETNLDVLIECVEHLVDPLEREYPMLLLERSGGKGYHVWLFFDGPVEAYRVRAWLDHEFWPRWNLQTNATPLEVFPKQDSLSEGGMGNLVKLPLGVHAVSGKRSETVDLGHHWISEVIDIRGLSEKLIPEYEQAKPEVREAITAATPTGILLADGPVSRLLQGEVVKGERNGAFHAFFTWTAWNVHLPKPLAWEWCEQLNEALAEPEGDEDSIRKTMDSAYARPPADAASPRPSRGSAPSTSGYSRTPRSERMAERGLVT